MPYKDPEKKKQWERENRGRGKRHRVWMFIFYENTANDGWRDEAEELGLPFCVSPLHDMDVWTKADERKNPKHKAGEKKEAHYHGLVEYPQPVDYETVKADFAFLGTHSIKYAKSKASMALYLTHEKCKDKAQYDSSGVLEFGGADWRDWCSELEDVHAMMLEMRDFIRENNFTEFADFQDWCDANNDIWSRALDLRCAWAIGNYIDRYRKREEQHAKAMEQARARAEWEEKNRKECAEDDGDWEDVGGGRVKRPADTGH